MPNSSSTILNPTPLLFLLLCPATIPAQTATEIKPQSKPSEIETHKVNEADLLGAQRRAFAISLLTSLADEARSYHDFALRARVIARAADALWGADNITARLLFRRAWEAAEKGDAEEVTVKTKDKLPPMAISLRRGSGRDLRSEVLSLAARRDRALGEEFLAKLKDETKRDTEDSKSAANSRNTGDSSSSSEAALRRLQLARKLLDDGEIDQALGFAAPALDQVNGSSIGFLSALRAKKPEAADQGFAFLLARTELNPSADANTVSGLSSYAFTPDFYVNFSPDGGARWTQENIVSTTPPNLPPALRNRFFQVASDILLRPLPPPDQDFTSSGRAGKYMVIRRLLPLFDQYAPDIASALRAELTVLEGESLKVSDYNTSLLVKGLKPEETAGDALAKLQDRIDHAKTSRERDLIYADAAVVLANQGDTHARDIADRIDDSDRRAQVRRYVDLSFVKLAIKKKDATEVARLAKAGQLTHPERAWAYTQAARLLMNSDRERALGYLQDAADEARRINSDDPDRARALIAVVMQYVVGDNVTAWEIMGEAIKAANSAEDFTGENAQLTFGVASKSGVNIISIDSEDLGLSAIFRSLTKDDFYRSAELAKSLKYDAPRATATLAIARTVLEK